MKPARDGRVPNLVSISEAASLGLHTMALLAREPGVRLSTQDLAGRLGGSEHHLAKVMRRLARGGFVDSTRGPGGGFRLARSAGKIKLLEIYEAVEGPLRDAGCLLGEPICRGGECPLGEVIHAVHKQVRDHLSKTTLAALARGLTLERVKS